MAKISIVHHLAQSGEGEVVKVDGPEVFGVFPTAPISPLPEAWPTARFSFFKPGECLGLAWRFTQPCGSQLEFHEERNRLEARLKAFEFESYAYSLPTHGGPSRDCRSTFLEAREKIYGSRLAAIVIDVAVVTPIGRPIPTGPDGWSSGEILLAAQEKFDLLRDAVLFGGPMAKFTPPLGCQGAAISLSTKGPRLDFLKHLQADRLAKKLSALETNLRTRETLVAAENVHIAALKAEIESLRASNA